MAEATFSALPKQCLAISFPCVLVRINSSQLRHLEEKSWACRVRRKTPGERLRSAGRRSSQGLTTNRRLKVKTRNRQQTMEALPARKRRITSNQKIPILQPDLPLPPTTPGSNRLRLKRGPPQGMGKHLQKSMIMNPQTKKMNRMSQAVKQHQQLLQIQMSSKAPLLPLPRQG